MRGAGAIIERGPYPNVRTKTRVKWLWSAKPRAAAMSWTGKVVWSIITCAVRRRVEHPGIAVQVLNSPKARIFSKIVAGVPG